MNDFDYENLQKKRIARGAYAKKGGSRSKKCTLPGDYLTPSQKKKLSTTIVSVTMTEPMSLEDFKKLPTDIKREYLEWLHSEFRVTQQMVSTDLFGMDKHYLAKLINTTETGLKGIFPKKRQKAFTAEESRKWECFVTGRPIVNEVLAEIEDEEEEHVPVEQYVPETPKTESVQAAPTELAPSHISATYDGELYASDLQAIIYRLVKSRSCKSITIDINF